MILVGFTNRTRAEQRRGCFVLGKMARIYKDLPRSAWLPPQRPVRKLQVRTSFLEEVTPFCIVVCFRENSPCFRLFHEPDGRFEPTGAVTLRLALLLLQDLLLLDQSIPRLAVLDGGNILVEVDVHETLELLVNRVDVLLDARHDLSCDVCLALALGLQLGDHPVRPRGRESNVGECGIDLPHDVLLTHEPLRAILFHSLRAAEIVVTLLRLGGDEAAALAAAEEAAVEVGLQRRGLRLALPPHHFLAFVKERFGNERRMLAFVKLAVEANEAVVDGVLEHVLVVRDGEQPASPPDQTHAVHDLVHLRERVVAGGVEFESLPNEGRLVLVNVDRPGLGVVEISQGCLLREDPVQHLLPLPSPNVLRQGIDVILAHAEHEGECELALARRLEVHVGELHVPDDAAVHQVDDPPAVEHVAGQTIRMPCKDAVGLSLLDACEHVVEHGTPRRLGASLFSQHVNNRKVVLAGKLTHFGQLVFDASYLSVVALS